LTAASSGTTPEAPTFAPADAGLDNISAGELRLAVAPQVGGSIAAFTREWREAGQARTLHWLRPATAVGLAARDPLSMASFPLVPFCNRIRNGRAQFEGREIRFPPNHPAVDSPHPLHGIGWLQPWQVTSQQPAEVALALEVPATEAWPWRFSAEQHYALDAQALRVDIRITNRDTAPMPAGIGHHPYFPHTPGTRLTAPTRAMWRGDAEVMPLGLEEGPVVDRLREGVVLAELDLDNNFTGWERMAQVDWPADTTGPARSLRMQAEAPLDFFVVYCPRGYDHFCAEPVSQCTDWLNLMPQHGPESLGGQRLAPGETLEARFTLRPQWS
jgi:aldose 1-epimerase